MIESPALDARSTAARVANGRVMDPSPPAAAAALTYQVAPAAGAEPASPASAKSRALDLMSDVPVQIVAFR
jgi:hypothetical protein